MILEVYHNQALLHRCVYTLNRIALLKIGILAGAAFLLGYLLGRKTRHAYGGEIVFEKKPDGEERCAFVLENDDDWLSRQKSVIFKVKHTAGNTTYEKQT